MYVLEEMYDEIMTIFDRDAPYITTFNNYSFDTWFKGTYNLKKYRNDMSSYINWNFEADYKNVHIQPYLSYGFKNNPYDKFTFIVFSFKFENENYYFLYLLKYIDIFGKDRLAEFKKLELVTNLTISRANVKYPKNMIKKWRKDSRNKKMSNQKDVVQSSSIPREFMDDGFDIFSEPNLVTYEDMNEPTLDDHMDTELDSNITYYSIDEIDRALDNFFNMDLFSNTFFIKKN